MISEKYAKYYKTKPYRDFSSRYPTLTLPAFNILGRDWNSNFNMDWFCVTEPFLMITEPHTHDFDQYLVFQNADATKVDKFDAEVWLHLGPKEEQEKLVITKAGYVYIPAGLVHTPLEFVKINKPIVFMDITLTAKYLRKPEDPSKPTVTYKSQQ